MSAFWHFIECISKALIQVLSLTSMEFFFFFFFFDEFSPARYVFGIIEEKGIIMLDLKSASG